MHGLDQGDSKSDLAWAIRLQKAPETRKDFAEQLEDAVIRNWVKVLKRTQCGGQEVRRLANIGRSETLTRLAQLGRATRS